MKFHFFHNKSESNLHLDIKIDYTSNHDDLYIVFCQNFKVGELENNLHEHTHFLIKRLISIHGFTFNYYDINFYGKIGQFIYDDRVYFILLDINSSTGDVIFSDSSDNLSDVSYDSFMLFDLKEYRLNFELGFTKLNLNEYIYSHLHEKNFEDGKTFFSCKAYKTPFFLTVDVEKAIY